MSDETYCYHIKGEEMFRGNYASREAAILGARLDGIPVDEIETGISVQVTADELIGGFVHDLIEQAKCNLIEISGSDIADAELNFTDDEIEKLEDQLRPAVVAFLDKGLNCFKVESVVLHTAEEVDRIWSASPREGGAQ